MKARTFGSALFVSLGLIGLGLGYLNWHRFSAVPVKQPVVSVSIPKKAPEKQKVETSKAESVLETDLKTNAEHIAETSALVARELAVLDSIEEVESRYDRGELSSAQYLDLRKHLEEEILAER